MHTTPAFRITHRHLLGAAATLFAVAAMAADPVGEWKVTVTDIATGTQAKKTVNIQ